MIEVQHLTKRYGPTTAVDDVSFRVEKAKCSASSGRMARARPPQCGY